MMSKYYCMGCGTVYTEKVEHCFFCDCGEIINLNEIGGKQN